MTTPYPPEWDVRDRESVRPDWSDPDIEALADAYHSGIYAYSLGTALSANPYSVDRYAREWHHGWRDAEQADGEK